MTPSARSFACRAGALLALTQLFGCLVTYDPESVELAGADGTESCGNGLDDDGDGDTDCADGDCSSTNACATGGQEVCDNASDDDADGLFDCDDGDCAGAPACGGGSCPATEIGSTLGEQVVSDFLPETAGQDQGTCGGANGAEMVYAWDAPSAGDFNFSTEGSQVDTVLYLRLTACSGVEVGCDDNGGLDGVSSIVRATLAVGQRVYVYVDAAAAGVHGTFTLGIMEAP